MFISLLKKLSYANVMATLAFFVALSGASYAAIKIPAHSVGTKQLKPHSVGTKQLKRASVDTRQLRKRAVATKNLKPSAVGSDQLAAASVGDREVEPGSLTFAALAPGQVSPRLFAHVSSNGDLGDNAGVTAVGHPSTGIFEVTFVRDLHGCVPVANVGFGFGSGVIGAGGTAQASMIGGAPDTVRVTVYRKGFTFNDVENDDINLVVLC